MNKKNHEIQEILKIYKLNKKIRVRGYTRSYIYIIKCRRIQGIQESKKCKKPEESEEWKEYKQLKKSST
jgi:hypothetical protein